MKKMVALACLAVLVAVGAMGQESGVLVSFGIDDVIVMNRTATAFQGEGGPAPGAGYVEYYVCRGEAFDALAPDLREALEGRRAVCIGQYKSGGMVHRVLYTVDDSPVCLGVFRREEGGRWVECTGEVPRPDPWERPSQPLGGRYYERAAEIGGKESAVSRLLESIFH